MNDFLKNFNNPLMQAVQFAYKGVKYNLVGYWGLCIANETDNEEIWIDNGGFDTKYEAFEYPVFDEGTKSLKDIIDEITDVEFDF